MKLAHIGTALPPRDERDWVVSQELIDAAGITYRQLDYWCRTGLLMTLDGNNPGQGWTRRFPTDQVRRVRAVKALLDAGVSVTRIREVIDQLLEHGHVDLSPTVTLALDLTGDPAA